MPKDPTLRTEEDLQRVVRALAREFKTDTVFIIRSQAILMSWPDAPGVMRGSPEIDAYPGNARMWEIAEGEKGDGEPLEASEHIDGLFGSSSAFHRTHGFFIDGTDENTAKLPKGWKRTRAFDRQVQAASVSYWTTSSLTFARPAPTIPSASAAAYETSTVRPATYGPRSLTRTVTDLPVATLVTRNLVPNGKVG